MSLQVVLTQVAAVRSLNSMDPGIFSNLIFAILIIINLIIIAQLTHTLIQNYQKIEGFCGRKIRKWIQM